MKGLDPPLPPNLVVGHEKLNQMSFLEITKGQYFPLTFNLPNF